MRPLPQATCDRLRRLCEVHPQRVAAEIVGCSTHTIQLIKRRGWKAGRSGPPARPMPSDFAVQANYLTIKQLYRHYQTSQQTVYRWLKHIERSYEPRKVDLSKQIPNREEIAAAIAEHGVTRAASVLGVHSNTLLKWRVHHGLPISWKRRKSKRAAPARPAWAYQQSNPA